MADTARKITAESLHARLPVENPHDEFGRLAGRPGVKTSKSSGARERDNAGRLASAIQAATPRGEDIISFWLARSRAGSRSDAQRRGPTDRRAGNTAPVRKRLNIDRCGCRAEIIAVDRLDPTRYDPSRL